MVERICGQCKRNNPVENRFCGQCGGQLDYALPRRRDMQAVSVTERPLPATQLKHIGQTVAVSLAALAAEAALSWLSRRVKQPSPVVPRGPKSEKVALRPSSPQTERYTITTLSQHFVEIRKEEVPSSAPTRRLPWRQNR